MTTGRTTKVLSALALGLATVIAVPALAQTSTGGTSQPSATTSTPPATSAAPAAGSTSSQPKMATKPMHPMKSHMAMHETHHGMRTRVSQSNPNAQDSAVDQLNQQSLQAAQQGKPFSPPSGRL